jgi:hypothetical protein
VTWFFTPRVKEALVLTDVKPVPGYPLPDAQPTAPAAGWLELENDRVDAVDFAAVDLPLDLDGWLARALVMVAGTVALTAWLLRAG